MATNISDALLALSETDKKIYELATEKNEIESVRGGLLAQIEIHKQTLSETEAQLQQRSTRQVEEEDRLKSEQQRLVDQRKQLTTIGGAKSAKLVERQLDIASRTLQTMEERALRVVEEVDDLESRADSIRDALRELGEKLESESPEQEKTISALEKEINSFNKERDSVLGKLDDRLQRLYVRVSKRYPESAVAVAKNGACHSCYRFLPAQTYNQIIAGNLLIQCPGCSRILVYGGDDAPTNGEPKKKPKKKATKPRAKIAAKK